MKTAISVEDGLMARADEAARDLGLSRSGLVAEALRRFLEQRRADAITEQLDRVYAASPADPNDSRVLRRMRSKLKARDRW